MKTTSNIFKVTDLPVIVKTPAIRQGLSIEDVEKRLVEQDFVPLKPKERTAFATFLQPYGSESSTQPQNVAESPAPYPTKAP